MSFKVVGKGLFSKEGLVSFLNAVGIENPGSVVREAENGRTMCGDYRILLVR